jgi:lambda family phage tail tape measure protein
MANIIAGLGAQLGLDTTEFRKGIGEAKKELKEFAEYLPEALSVAAFVEMTNKALEFSNQIVETAKANDIATSSVLELSKALQENGGDMEDTGRIYSGFTQKIESAVQGNAKAQESFARLGVTLNDLRHMSEQDLFSKTVTGLANMKDSAERNGLAFMTLGKAIRGVDIKGLAATLEESRGEMDRYAKSIEMAHALSEKLKISSHNLLLEFTNAFIPTMAALYDHFNKTGNAMQRVFSYLKIGAEGFGIFASAAITALEHIWSVVKVLGKDLYAVFDPREYLSGTLFKTLAKNFDDFKTEFATDTADYIKSLDEIKTANDEALKPKERQDIERTATASNAKQLEAAKALILQYQNQADLTLLTLKNKESAAQMTAKEKEIQTEVNAVLEANVKAIDAIKTKIATIDTSTAAGKSLKEEFERQKVLIEMQADFYVEQTRKTVEENQKLRESFSYGWDQAFKQYQENATNAADVGRQYFNSVIGSMDNALSNFVKTGKLNFNSLAQSIIQNLLTIQLTAQANQLFSGMALGSASLAGLFGGAKYTPGSNSFVGPMPQFADGGDPPVGQASLVGERGPELFIPKSAGTIIPNNKLSGMGGGGSTTVNNYNIHAIDTQSFEQRLYQSSGAIWAANQYASKNTSTTRSRV